MYIDQIQDILDADRIRYVEVLQVYESPLTPVVVEVAVTNERTATLGLYKQDDGSYKIQKILKEGSETEVYDFLEYVKACND